MQVAMFLKKAFELCNHVNSVKQNISLQTLNGNHIEDSLIGFVVNGSFATDGQVVFGGLAKPVKGMDLSRGVARTAKKALQKKAKQHLGIPQLQQCARQCPRSSGSSGQRNKADERFGADEAGKLVVEIFRAVTHLNEFRRSCSCYVTEGGVLGRFKPEFHYSSS